MACTIRTEVFGPKYCTRARLIAITSAMIRNGFITYPEAIPSLRNYEPPPVVAVLLSAILSTLLSYQMAAIIHDLCLGIKPRGRSRYISVAAALTIHDYSLSAWLARITQHPAILWFRFHRWSEICSSTDDRHKLSRRARLWLVALGLVVPITNLAAVVLTLEFEGEANISFQEAQFGGISLGVSDKKNVLEDEIFGCKKISMQLRRLETPLSSFHVCQNNYVYYPRNNSSEYVSVTVLSEAVSVEIKTPEFVFYSEVSLQVQSKGSTYAVGSELRKDEQEELFKRAVMLMRKLCREERKRDAKVVPTETSIKLVSKFHCKDPADVRDGIVWQVADVLGAVDTNSTRLIRINALGNFRENPFSEKDHANLGRQVNMGKLALLKRQRSFGFFWLSTLTVVVVVLRVIVSCLTRNDVEIGVEKLFKDGVGGLPWDSVLQSSQWVRWDGKVEIGGSNGKLDNIEMDCFIDELT